ncbi:hypothetical protein CKO38_08905 [Rhodospirillum rubrum]|uniref:hypothetical protein n=1 Tax=Rhodospirillum rubrum TaxID=1085 RepID=UPI001905ED8A|nr:hypothetical protein [Rhodospirillum rubrum]MBK1665170.1 hypothetical protein [Rhodospirillum rubrum]MBK1676787.1 hypothetical protein [Rhodospirillum rubrum]
MSAPSDPPFDSKTAAAVVLAGKRAQGGERPPLRPGDRRCQRCGATFRWDRSNHGDGWVMRLVGGSQRCDCGYGKRGGPDAD